MSVHCKTSDRRADLLRDLFQEVADKRNWKGPISTMVPEDMADLYAEAITFVTGSVVHRGKPVKRLQPGAPTTTNYVCLAADGYYATVGA